jgi:hypothetical protein
MAPGQRYWTVTDAQLKAMDVVRCYTTPAAFKNALVKMMKAGVPINKPGFPTKTYEIHGMEVRPIEGDAMVRIMSATPIQAV